MPSGEDFGARGIKFEQYYNCAEHLINKCSVHTTPFGPEQLTMNGNFNFFGQLAI